MLYLATFKKAHGVLLGSVLALLLLVPGSVGFVLLTPPTPFNNNGSSLDERRRTTTTTTRRRARPLHAAIIDVTSVDQARTAFFIWFFGASGGVGIATKAFPRMYKNFQTTRQMKVVAAPVAAARGPRTAPPVVEEMIGISPLCGYPQDIPVRDVQQIVQKSRNMAELIQKYPIADNFLSQQGYLTYAAFQKAHVKCNNPLAVRAVFDALNKGADVCIPDQAQAIIDELIDNPKLLATKVLQAKAVGYAAITALLFLLAVAFYETFIVHLRLGWFPAWPGLENLPSSLFDPATGLTAIPQYWLGEYK
jgi:hypothetical protein